MDCIFCKIIDGDIPSAVIYEDEETFAFLDANPVNMGHALVIPKEHHRNILDTPEPVMCEVMRTAKKLTPAIKNAMDAGGVNVTNNNEPAAGQKVFHYHVHIIPRHEGDGFEMWHGDRGYREGEKQEIVEKITNEL